MVCASWFDRMTKSTTGSERGSSCLSVRNVRICGAMLTHGLFISSAFRGQYSQTFEGDRATWATFGPFASAQFVSAAEWRSGALLKNHIPSLKCPISSCLVPNDSSLSGLSDATSLKVTRRIVLMILNLMPGRVRQQIESLSRPCISPNISD